MTPLRTHAGQGNWRRAAGQLLHPRAIPAVLLIILELMTRGYKVCLSTVNACSETLFGSLKVERLHGQNLETRRQAKDEVIDRLLVQPGSAALDAGLRQPDDVRARLACQSTKASQFVTRLSGTDSRGKVNALDIRDTGGSNAVAAMTTYLTSRGSR